MTELEDDIARIAALRGKKAEDYAPAARAKLAPHPTHIDLIMTPQPNRRRDIRATDTLPPASREFLRESPLMLNSVVWADALAGGIDEGLLLEAVRVAVERKLGQPLATFRRHRRRRLS